MSVSLVKTSLSKGVSLAKNPLFLMVDTETIYLHKRVYELGYIVFDSVTCQIVDKGRFLIRETLESALYCFLKLKKMPIFWPDSRLNVIDCMKHKDCVSWQDAIGALLASVRKHDIAAFIAHNINFDIEAIYKTSKMYSSESEYNSMFSITAGIKKLELSGYFIHNLAKNTAFNVPFKAKSGCMTFKADYLVPYLIGGIQAHDALGDCQNQLDIYKLTKGRYQNQGSIFGNMKAYHAVQHDKALRLGNREIE